MFLFAMVCMLGLDDRDLQPCLSWIDMDRLDFMEASAQRFSILWPGCQPFASSYIYGVLSCFFILFLSFSISIYVNTLSVFIVFECLESSSNVEYLSLSN